MLTSGMTPQLLPFTKVVRPLYFVAASALAACLVPCFLPAQTTTPAPTPSIMDRLNAMLGEGKSVWTPQQLDVMARPARLSAARSLRPRRIAPSHRQHRPTAGGSPQAQAAVDYVAAEMRSLGAKVTLEKAMVPHWVRGVETAELTAWPGQAAGTRKQKIVLTALGVQCRYTSRRPYCRGRSRRRLAAAARLAAGRAQRQDSALQPRL